LQKRLAVSSCALVIGISLIVVALARPAAGPQRVGAVEARGGTLRLDLPGDFLTVDPTLTYDPFSWQLMVSVCANLYGYPDREAKTLRPILGTAAAFPRVTRNGKRVIVTVRSEYARFSDGAAVTAASYANAIQRALDPKMQSPFAQYLTDIVGAKAVLRRKARRASGVQVQGNRLVLVLERPVPDLVARLTMPSFCPQPGANGLPRNPDGIGAPFNGGGPYMLQSWTPRRSATVTRNPYWSGAIAKTRPANVDRIEYTLGVAPPAEKLRTDRDQTDVPFTIPPPAWGELVRRYGVNRARVFVRSGSNVWYFHFNHDRPLFGPRGSEAGNVALKRAINYAIDRGSLARQFGYRAASPTDQLLPPSMPGFRDWHLYQRDLARARRLAAGNTRGGKAVLYAFSVPPFTAMAEIFRQQMREIGLDVEIRTFVPPVATEKMSTRGEPFDIALIGFAADYADPNAFLRPLLSSAAIGKTSTNLDYFANRRFDRMLERASRLTGASRYTAFANLDRVTMRDAVPVAPFASENARFYVSESVGCFSAPGGLVNLVALCKK
jgi:peptide/nickel transport system substrate-binding protein